MSFEDSIRQVDVLLGQMEHAYRDVIKFKSSKVKLPAKELNLLTALGNLRDVMWRTMKDTDREKLNEFFGGDCQRVARVKAVLDKVEISDMNKGDQRLEGCLNACTSVEKVLIDLGSYDKLKEAEEAAKAKLEEEAAGGPRASVDTQATVESEDPSKAVPDWAGDGVQVVYEDEFKVQKFGVLAAPARDGEPWKIRYPREDGKEAPVTDWSQVSKAAASALPAWASGAGAGKMVVRAGRKGQIVSTDPWKIQWEDGTFELVVDWAGIEEEALKIPEWAKDGTPIRRRMGGRKGVVQMVSMVSGYPGGKVVEQGVIRWEDGTTEVVADWAGIEEAPSSPVPGWVAGGVAVLKGGRAGTIISGPDDLWKIQWVDEVEPKEELIFDWADIKLRSSVEVPIWAKPLGTAVLMGGTSACSTRGCRWGKAELLACTSDGSVLPDPSWFVKWEDATTSEFITDWAGMEEAPPAPPPGEAGKDRLDSENPTVADELASPDEAPPVGAVVEDDWAELMGIKMCKIGCGRRCAPGVTKHGKPFDTCCRDCAFGRGHHKTCGHIDASKVGSGFCKMGCGRRNNPGKDSLGMPRDTCCRNCAIGEVATKGHDPKCQKCDGSDDGKRSSVVTMHEHAFFAEAKQNMSLVDFNRLMEQCRFLNRGTQTLDETLFKCFNLLFGTKLRPLYPVLERLLKDRMMALEAEKVAAKKGRGKGGGGYR